MVTKNSIRQTRSAAAPGALPTVPNRTIQVASQADGIEPVQAAETILRRYGARAISILTNPRVLEDGRTIPARMSANDCYVVMEEACRKMARVAVRKFAADSRLQAIGYTAALDTIFPDPPAYLTRCIRSVVSDVERGVRREVPTVSMDQPLTSGDNALCLGDTIADTQTVGQPEEALIEKDERLQFRHALAAAMQSIPKNYLAALQRDIDRDRERQDGNRVAPETASERQTVCRARAALSEILKRECGLDNPFVRLLAQQRSSRVRTKQTASPNWTAERQNSLFRRLLGSSWEERSSEASHPEDNIEEAIVNNVSAVQNIAPPSPEMRQAMRVMDVYYFGDNPTTETVAAQDQYDLAIKARNAGRIEEAIGLYRAAYELEPRFFAACNEVGVLLMQTGNLRDALKIYLSLVENPNAGDHKFIAANNAADVYLHWYDAGRNKERNIERATYYAQFAMQQPRPMRACNLILAYVKDKYYVEAQKVMDTVLQSGLADCPADKFLQTLFQIRDADLVAWWTWLDSEIGKDN